jgi:MarR family transcriptional regulator, transcriptional regulator for hemolysin
MNADAGAGAAGPGAAARLEDDLGWRLGVAGRLIRTWADARLAEEGIGAQGLALLLWLAEERALTQVELARRQRVEGPSVCRMVDRLERDGLVERRPHPMDRRATEVHLTPAGQDVAARGRAAVDGLASEVFAPLDEDERRTLAELLGRVIDAGPAGDR